jgi:hypothetical protein
MKTLKHSHKRYFHRRHRGWLVLLLIAVMLSALLYYQRASNSSIAHAPASLEAPTPHVPGPGTVLGIDSVQTFTTAQTVTLTKEDYGSSTPAITTGMSKITFHYRSELPGGQAITIYGRAYLPADARKNLPIFAFAPGTTGIGDQCAPSLENPPKTNWANYDSHMATYASQGYAAVITDYEGLRDPTRIHHYMVGELEGRAVLDSIRALRRLPQAKSRLSAANVFLGGYSQGGHAAFWADKIASSYAPDIKPKGVVGFGPVMNVAETLTDITRGANINWFGPYVLYSYHDYYQADYGSVLLPRWADTLNTDVPAHCIDTDIPFWGHVPANVYTPEFLQSVAAGTLATDYPDLMRDLDRNAVGADSTASAKRINQGALDNVVLPAQQQAAFPTLCTSSTGPVQLAVYTGATHYDTMVRSLKDTLNWMQTLSDGKTVKSTCPAQG